MNISSTTLTPPTQHSAPSTQHHIILFDGVCNLCNGFVNFVLDRDKKKKFIFGSLQSDAAKRILYDHHVQIKSNGELESVILIKNNKVFKKSGAALEIAKDLGGIWKIFYVLKIFPAFIRDFVYDFIAKYRYRWFGKSETCRVPEPGIKERFLD